jgi:hypothetical protein
MRAAICLGEWREGHDATLVRANRPVDDFARLARRRVLASGFRARLGRLAAAILTNVLK